MGALDLALWLEADRLGTLPTALTQENLDNQRDVVKEEKRQRYDNQPYGDVLEHLTSLTFPADHPYGHTTIGSMEDLDAATLEDALEFFNTWYVPGNAVLTLVGDIEPELGFTKADRFLGSVPAGSPPVRRAAQPLPRLSGVPRVVTDARVPSGAVYFAWRLPARETPQMDALELALDILGGSDASRMHRALVRDSSVSSGAGASAIGLAEGNSFGFAYARALDGTSLSQLESAMVDQVSRLATDGPTEAEVARSQIQFERAWLEQCADFASRATPSARLPRSTATRDDQHQAVEHAADHLSDVREAAREFWTPTTGRCWSTTADRTNSDDAQPPRCGTAPALELSHRRDAQPPERDEGSLLPPSGPARGCGQPRDRPPLSLEPPGKEGLAGLVARTLSDGTRSLPGTGFEDAIEDCGARFDTSVGYSADRFPGCPRVPVRPGDGPAVTGRQRAHPRRCGPGEEPCAAPDRHPAPALQSRATGQHRMRRALIDHRYRSSLMVGGHPATIDALDGAAARDFHRRLYQPSSATLVIAGDLPDNAVSAVEESFGRWTDACSGIRDHERPVPNQQTAQILDRPESVQADIRLANFTIDRADPAGPTSRLLPASSAAPSEAG